MEGPLFSLPPRLSSNSPLSCGCRFGETCLWARLSKTSSSNSRCLLVRAWSSCPDMSVRWLTDDVTTVSSGGGRGSSSRNPTVLLSSHHLPCSLVLLYPCPFQDTPGWVITESLREHTSVPSDCDVWLSLHLPSSPMPLRGQVVGSLTPCHQRIGSPRLGGRRTTLPSSPLSSNSFVSSIVSCGCSCLIFLFTVRLATRGHLRILFTMMHIRPKK